VPVVPGDDVQRRLVAPADAGHLALAAGVPDVASGDGDAIADSSSHGASYDGDSVTIPLRRLTCKPPAHTHATALTDRFLVGPLRMFLTGSEHLRH